MSERILSLGKIKTAQLCRRNRGLILWLVLHRERFKWVWFVSDRLHTSFYDEYGSADHQAVPKQSWFKWSGCGFDLHKAIVEKGG